MAGRGRSPKINRQNKYDTPGRGEYQTLDTTGWQHGDKPAPPDGLMPASVEAWSTWLDAWFAAFWTPGDLPGLRALLRLYDQVERGEFQRAAELRLQMDTYGITPKGQQDRRWKPPAAPRAGGGSQLSTYSHLRVVDVDGGES